MMHRGVRKFSILYWMSPVLMVFTGCSSWPLQRSDVAATTASAPARTTATPSASPSHAVERPFALTDETEYDSFTFASPSGKLLCTISHNEVVCDAHNLKQATVPTVENCGGMDNGEPQQHATDLVLGDRVVPYCYNDSAYIESDASSPPSWVRAGVGEIKTFPNGTYAVLPYGQALIDEDFLCTSEQFGVTCVNLRTKHGMLIRAAGLVEF